MSKRQPLLRNIMQLYFSVSRICLAFSDKDYFQGPLPAVLLKRENHAFFQVPISAFDIQFLSNLSKINLINNQKSIPFRLRSVFDPLFLFGAFCSTGISAKAIGKEERGPGVVDVSFKIEQHLIAAR